MYDNQARGLLGLCVGLVISISEYFHKFDWILLYNKHSKYCDIFGS